MQTLTGSDLTKQDAVLAKNHKEALTQLIFIIKKNKAEEEAIKKQNKQNKS